MRKGPGSVLITRGQSPSRGSSSPPLGRGREAARRPGAPPRPVPPQPPALPAPSAGTGPGACDVGAPVLPCEGPACPSGAGLPVFPPESGSGPPCECVSVRVCVCTGSSGGGRCWASLPLRPLPCLAAAGPLGRLGPAPPPGPPAVQTGCGRHPVCLGLVGIVFVHLFSSQFRSGSQLVWRLSDPKEQKIRVGVPVVTWGQVFCIPRPPTPGQVPLTSHWEQRPREVWLGCVMRWRPLGQRGLGVLLGGGQGPGQAGVGARHVCSEPWSHEQAVGTGLSWAVRGVPRGSRRKALGSKGGAVRAAHPSCE